MSKLHSSRHILKVLMKNGFKQVGQTGSHIKLRKDDLTVIVPAAKKEIPMGTYMSILRQSKLSRDSFD